MSERASKCAFFLFVVVVVVVAVVAGSLATRFSSAVCESVNCA